MAEAKQNSSWMPIAATGIVAAALIAVGGYSSCNADDPAPLPVGAPAAGPATPDSDGERREPATISAADLAPCAERGENCGGKLPTLVAPPRPGAPDGFRSLRTLRTWAVGEDHLRLALQTKPASGVGPTSLVLAEIDASGQVTHVLPPVEHGSKAYWVGDRAYVVATPSGEDWTVQRFHEGVWTTAGTLGHQRTAEAVGPVPGGVAVVYLRRDATAVLARFDDEGGAPEQVDLLRAGLPWLRTRIAADGEVVALRSREAEDREGPPRLEVSVLEHGSVKPAVTETTIPELKFDKVGFVLDHCFADESLWGLVAGYILMVSHDAGRSWSRAHTFDPKAALHGVSLACADDRLVIAGNGPDAKPWGAVCNRDDGCTELQQISKAHAQWLSADASGAILWHPSSTVRVAHSTVSEEGARVRSVFVATGIDDARKSLRALRAVGVWFTF